MEIKRPLVVGVAGGSGSGKTRLAKNLAESLGSDACVTILHDSYYRDQGHLAEDLRDSVNYDHPDALESDLLAKHLAELRAGHSVEIPVYDYVTHTRKKTTERVSPLGVVIVEGIMVLAERSIREQLDIRVFVDTDSDLRVLRRIKRDINKRGRSFMSVYEQYQETVRPMHLAYVEPSKRWADVIIPEGGKNPIALDLILARLRQGAN